MTTKPVTDWTEKDFIQHEANLDHYERVLSGYMKYGEPTHSEVYVSVERAVQTGRATRRAYFDHFGVKPELQ